ncbi:hypothetical protein [Clavibacter zhangzhiyongii]|uniref:hypothetical protein n=1 Tax=Clavibacter zhangzhiyongii TaxID=2768071 RepID=UPI0019584DAB|nr:hypothetical protein [Clavibacter zhangzhiyongii]MBM7026277.1 hypothetical protein [Clavibacter zhangzhiyongii]
MEPHERADPDGGSRRAERAELAGLRRRAYGPAGAVDPVDLDRLRVLEARWAAAGPAVRPTPARPAEAEAEAVLAAEPGPPDTERSAAEGSGAERSAAAPDDTTSPSRRRPRRLLAILWAASLVVAVALTAVVTSAASAPAGREVAVVRFDPDQELPVYMRDYFGGAETGSARFHGLTLVRLENDRSAYPQVLGECLAIQPARAALGTAEAGGCAAGAFGASAQFVVNTGAPEELRDEFPVGTALLFDLRGDAVHVRVDESARVPTPTRPPT